MMTSRRRPTAATAIKRLETIKDRYDQDTTATKIEVLRALARTRISQPRQLLAYHDALCFLEAWPDNATVLALAKDGLASFEKRVSRRTRDDLANTGLAGTAIEYAFSYPSAAWLHRHWPQDITIDWDTFDQEDQLLAYLPTLAAHAEHDALDDTDISTRAWLTGGQSSRTDFAALLGLFEQSALARPMRDTVYELLDVPVTWQLRSATAARTVACLPVDQVHYQCTALDRRKPDPLPIIRRRLRRTRPLSRRDGQVMIHSGLAALSVRLRELYALLYANADDVTVVDLDRGLQVVLVGVLPQYRLPLETPYYFQALKNGVPIGYGCITGLADRAEVAANIFPEFRWGESAYLYVQLLRIAHQWLGARRFIVDPYQIGEDNEEAIEAGVFWFYYKLGFRPTDPAIARQARTEAERIRRRPTHRTSARILRQLAGSAMMLSLDTKTAAKPELHPGRIGMAVTRHVAAQFNNDRRAATRAAMRELQQQLPIGNRRRYRRSEWQALERWSLVLVQTPDLARWPAAAKRDLVALVRAKGQTSELPYLRQLQRHPRLIRALAKLG